jgi:AGCS family alanine or glycine:cation symporter
MIQAIDNVVNAISGFLYQPYIVPLILVLAGLYFTIRLGLPQFSLFGESIRVVTEKPVNMGATSSFGALMVSTASRVGTGNIMGVSTAICLGGAGAIFWMWVTAILGGASAFVESTLAQIWKVRGRDGEFRGGPAYYIEQALGSRGVGILFAISLILCFALGFNGLQSYNMSSSIVYYVPNWTETQGPFVLGILLAVVLAFVLFGGTQRISFLASFIVPLMASVYLLLAVVLTLINIAELPAVLWQIIYEAFNPASLAGGFAGSMIVQGVKRGLFSNEAGMGSAPNAAASASVSHPVKQGMVQVLSVFLDTMVICTCSAVMIMFFVHDNTGTIAWGGADAAVALSNMSLVQASMLDGFGELGIHFMTFAIFCFAFSSLVGNYFYAEQNLRFITAKLKGDAGKWILFGFRILCCVVVFFGAQSNLTLAWNLADIFMGIEATINIGVILVLGKWAFAALADYEAQKAQGLDPVFEAENIPGMPATECWHETREELASATVEAAARHKAHLRENG